MKSIYLREYHEPLIEFRALCLQNTKIMLLSAEFRKQSQRIASVVKPKMRSALGIAVDFVVLII